MADVNGPSITCGVAYEARASGRGEATWEGATFKWGFGAGAFAVSDSVLVSSQELRAAMGQDTISASRPSRGRGWYFSGAFPFDLTATFRYRLTRRTEVLRTAPILFRCGPTLPANATLPQVSIVDVTSRRPELAVGDTITVTYEALAPTGLWVSVVEVEGAFAATRTFSDNGLFSVRRAVQFIVPAEAALGVPVTVRVGVADPHARVVGAVRQTVMQVADREPPTLTVLFMSPGSYAVGDTIALSFLVSDNRSLQWLFFRSTAPVAILDSVPLAGGARQRTVTLPFVSRAEWALANPDFTFWVRDGAGLESARVTAPTVVWEFYPVVVRTVEGPVIVGAPSAGSNLWDVLPDPARGRLLFVQPLAKRIVPFDVSTMSSGTAFMTTGSPYGADFSPGGDSLLIATRSPNEIVVIRLSGSSGGTRTTIPVGAIIDTMALLGSELPFPSSIRVAANGKAIVAMGTNVYGFHPAIELTLGTGALRFRPDLLNSGSGFADFSMMSASSPDRSRVHLLGGSDPLVYFAASDSFRRCGVNAEATGVSFDSTGRYVASYGTVTDVNTCTSVRFLGGPSTISPDGAIVYSARNGAVLRLRRSDGSIIDRSPIPVVARRLAVTPDGRYLIILSGITATVHRMALP